MDMFRFGDAGFLVDKLRSLEKSTENLRFVLALTIFCIVTTIGFGSHFYSELTDDHENLSSKLTSIEKNIKDLEDKIREIQLDNDELSSKLETNIKDIEEKVKQTELDNDELSLQPVAVNTSIDEALDAKNKTSEKITLPNNYQTSQLKMTSHGRLNDEVKTLLEVLVKNISDIVKGIHAMEEANEDLEERIVFKFFE